jgi:hypothetical protein
MKNSNVSRTALALALLFPSVIAYSQASQAHRLQLSPECKPKLRIAYAAVEDMNPLAPAFEFSNQVEDAKRSLREARGVAATLGDRTAIEEIETYRIQREACRPAPTMDAYRDCEKTAAVTQWQVSYGIGVAKNPPPPAGQ